MDGKQFYQSVVSHPDLEWRGVKAYEDARKDEVFICSKTTGRKYSIRIAAINDVNWEDLERVLIEGRDPFIMRHVTRIVGYYSNLANWNSSKIAELKDRQKGNYTFPEVNTVSVAAD